MLRDEQKTSHQSLKLFQKHAVKSASITTLQPSLYSLRGLFRTSFSCKIPSNHANVHTKF